MANGIPPFLPASPPPMCQLDYYEDEDEDEFGDLSNSASNGYPEANLATEELTTTDCTTKAENEDTDNMKRILHSEMDILPVTHQTEENPVTSVPDLSLDNDSSELPNSINETGTSEEEGESVSPPTEPILDNRINERDADKIVISTDKCDIAENSPSTDDDKEESESEDFVIPDCFITDEQTIREQLALDEPLPSVNLDKVMKTYEESSSAPVAVVAAASIEFDDFVSCSFENVEQQPSQKQEVNDLEFNFFMNSKANTEEYHEQQQPIEEVVTMCGHHTQQEEDAASEDDDFSDFVSTATAVPVAEGEVKEDDNDFEPFAEYVSSDGDSIRNAVKGTNEKTFEVDEVEYWNEIFKTVLEEQIGVNLNTLEGRLNGSSVWCKIKDIESSPALSYSWNNSETNKILLSALYVDSRNILFGPRWSSEVPRFASNLGFSPLVPQKASNQSNVPTENETSMEDSSKIFAENITSMPQTIPTAKVPDAHFDWNNSGLTNPLDSYSHSTLLDLDLLANFDIHSPYYKKNRKGGEKYKDEKAVAATAKSNHNSSLFSKLPHHKELSTEAKEVLNNLPNLCVMEKQYIVFPIS